LVYEFIFAPQLGSAHGNAAPLRSARFFAPQRYSTQRHASRRDATRRSAPRRSSARLAVPQFRSSPLFATLRNVFIYPFSVASRRLATPRAAPRGTSALLASTQRHRSSPPLASPLLISAQRFTARRNATFLFIHLPPPRISPLLSSPQRPSAHCHASQRTAPPRSAPLLDTARRHVF